MATRVPDDEFSELLSDPRLALRRPPPDLDLSLLRDASNAFMAKAPGPAVASVIDLRIPAEGRSVSVRIYRPSTDADLPVVIFTHGGGFVFGNLESHDAMCRALANGSDAAVVAIDYRLSPEARFPAAIEDCGTVVAWLGVEGERLRLDPTRLAFVGDSAGGRIAISATHRAIAAGAMPRHLGLFYPMVDSTLLTPSAKQFGTGYMLTTSFLDWAWDCYLPKDAGRGSANADADRSNIQTLPATTVVTAEFDPLRDEAEIFAALLTDSGIDAQCHRFAGTIHGFAGMPHVTPKASQAIDIVAARLAASLRRADSSTKS